MTDYPELNMKERFIITDPSSNYLFIYLHNINKLELIVFCECLNSFCMLEELIIFCMSLFRLECLEVTVMSTVDTPDNRKSTDLLMEIC